MSRSLGRASLQVRRSALRNHRSVTRLLPDRHLPWPVPGGWCYLNVCESPPMLARALRLYERDKFTLLEAHLRPGMSFVDVGANKGDFAVLAAARTGPNGTVVAVEPSPENARIVRRSVARSNHRNVHVVEAALAEHAGTAVLHLRQLSGWHTLLPAEDAVGEVTVETRTLDEVVAAVGLGSVDVVKVDVEGGELGVLRGGCDTIGAPGERLLLLDLHPPLVDPPEVAAMLRDRGYRILTPASPHVPLEVTATTREIVAWK